MVWGKGGLSARKAAKQFGISHTTLSRRHDYSCLQAPRQTAEFFPRMKSRCLRIHYFIVHCVVLFPWKKCKFCVPWLFMKTPLCQFRCCFNSWALLCIILYAWFHYGVLVTPGYFIILCKMLHQERQNSVSTASFIAVARHRNISVESV